MGICDPCLGCPNGRSNMEDVQTEEERIRLEAEVKVLRQENQRLREALRGMLESYELAEERFQKINPQIAHMIKGFFLSEPKKAHEALSPNPSE